MVDTIQSYFWQLCHPTRLQTPKSLTNPLFDTWALSEIVENQRIQGPGEIEALSIYTFLWSTQNSAAAAVKTKPQDIVKQ